MGKYLIIALLAVAPMFAQLPQTTTSLPSFWTISHDCTSAPCVWTVQKTASGTKKLKLDSVSVYCASAGTLTQERDGSAASGNTITPRLINTEASYTAGFTAHSASTSSGGTTIARAVNIPSGTEYPLELKDIYLLGNATTVNYTIRMSSGCGNASLLLKVQQYD